MLSTEDGAGQPRHLPSVEEAFYRAARDYPSTICPSELPFAEHRRKNGKLYAPATAEIPAFAPPTHGASTAFNFLLGTVLLPVHSVHPENLARLDRKTKPGAQLEWSSTYKGTTHDYVMPHLDPSTGSWAIQVANLFSMNHAAARATLFTNEAPVQLSLGGSSLADTEPLPVPGPLIHSPSAMPAVTVRSQKTWVKQFISALAYLETDKVIEPVYTLVGRGGNEEEEEVEMGNGGASGSGGAGGSRKRSLSSPTKDKKEEPPTGSGKKAKVGEKGTAKNTPSKQAKQNQRLEKRPPLGLPTHVKVAVYVPSSTASRLYSNFQNNTAPNIDSACNDRHHWSYYSKVFGYLLSAILTHGEGTLRVGPDSDGLLNTCDIPIKESEKVDRMTAQELSSQFNVATILNSISVTPELAEKRGLAPVPPGMLSKPKKYQLSGLQWMLDREQKGDARNRGHLALHPAWIQLVTQSGHVLYIHRIKNYVPNWNFFTAPPQGTCGGFVCDEMVRFESA